MNIDYRYRRKNKAAAVTQLHDSGLKRRDDLRAEHCENAVILPIRWFEKDEEGDFLLFGRGCVMDKDGKFLKLSGIKGRVGGSYEYDEPQVKDERVVFCGYLNPGWGHFLVEGVCRLWYALKNDKEVDKYIFINREDAGNEISGNFRKFLELFGIWDKTELIDKPVRYREVTVPELAFSNMQYYSDEYGEIFDRVGILRHMRGERPSADFQWSFVSDRHKRFPCLRHQFRWL